MVFIACMEAAGFAIENIISERRMGESCRFAHPPFFPIVSHGKVNVCAGYYGEQAALQTSNTLAFLFLKIVVSSYSKRFPKSQEALFRLPEITEQSVNLGSQSHILEP